jgi:6,7-dimethyl-8-ribityllumazine synthase
VTEGPDQRIEGAESLRVTEDGQPEHAPGRLEIPGELQAFVGVPNGVRRSVAIVVARFNGEITTRLLDGAVEALVRSGVQRDRIDVMQVPGAFELPLGAVALARTRRYQCIVALGCVIRGETPHFEYVAQEAASGLQLAALETGVPVSFGVLTCDTVEQAQARSREGEDNKGAEAARSALEMADVFSRLRRVAQPPAAGPAAPPAPAQAAQPGPPGPGPARQ